jgi:hypothetical protein
LYLARRSRTTGLLKRVIESSFDPSTVHYLKTFEQFWSGSPNRFVNARETIHTS